MCSEYVSGGTLNDRLMDTTVDMPWPLRIRLAKDVACGMVRKTTTISSVHHCLAFLLDSTVHTSCITLTCAHL